MPLNPQEVETLTEAIRDFLVDAEIDSALRREAGFRYEALDDVEEVTSEGQDLILHLEDGTKVRYIPKIMED